MKSYTFLILSCVLLSACGKQLQNFALSGTHMPTGPLNAPGIDQSGATNAIKVSPGATTSAGSQVQVTAAVTATNRQLQGTQVSARISINQNRQQ